jgi:Smg protein
MFDVLVYLFESFYHHETRPDQDTIARKLSAAGFEEEEIHEALAWLSGLQPLQGNLFDEHALGRQTSFRAHAQEEIAKLSPASRGFILFLENAHVLTPSLREAVMERAMALEEEVIHLDKLKVIALMVLWTQRGDVDSLILEELLPEGAPRQVH